MSRPVARARARRGRRAAGGGRGGAWSSPYSMSISAVEKPTPAGCMRRGGRVSRRARGGRRAGRARGRCGRAARLLNEDHVGELVPRVRVAVERALGVGAEGPLLAEEAGETGAPRPAVCPEHQRVLRRRALRLDEPVEELPPLADVNVSCRRRARAVSPLRQANQAKTAPGTALRCQALGLRPDGPESAPFTAHVS